MESLPSAKSIGNRYINFPKRTLGYQEGEQQLPSWYNLQEDITESTNFVQDIPKVVDDLKQELAQVIGSGTSRGDKLNKMM